MKNVYKIFEILVKILPIVSEILEVFKKRPCDNECSEVSSKSSE